MRPLFITGIGTDIGKTLVSAAIVEALDGDYWKPVQAGDLDQTDSMRVASFLSSQAAVVHPEQYRLKAAKSPHAAADEEGVIIGLETFTLPATDRPLVVEGAGGLLVPLNHQETVADLAHHLDCEIILVSRHYLGSINHTLLTVAEVRRRKLPLRGIIFNGAENPQTEQVIAEMTGAPILPRFPEMDPVSKVSIGQYANELRGALL